MRFTVVWLPAAEIELGRLYLASKVPAAVTSSANRIDSLLTHDPLEVGESRFGDLRVLIDAPIGVVYQVQFADRLVQVAHVWEFMMRRKDGS